MSPTTSAAPDRFSRASDHPSTDVEGAISKLGSLPKISPVPSATNEDIQEEVTGDQEDEGAKTKTVAE